MFNGIIKYTGKVKKIHIKKDSCIIEILSKLKFKKNEIGSSISCSGACLTLVKYKNNLACFYISKETLRKTVFKKIKRDDIVNVEKSLKFGTRISGHFVQGHVDCVAKVNKINFLGKSLVVNFKLIDKFKKYLIYKGSISINGVSLTISKVLKSGFQITVIPHTLKKTNLIYLKEKDLVNVEFDIIGKYIKNFNK